MSTVALPRMLSRIRCHYRPLILAGTALVLVGVFWFATRYPQLLQKAEHVGGAVPSMAFGSEVLHATVADSIPIRILAATVNWLASMKIGMTFGVLFGALLHTTLKYYPLKIGRNLYINSMKGALVGAPMGVCANCAVPMACGVSRGKGRVEVALGFLFSSPNFNPVVVMMTFTALPLGMFIAKYMLLVFVIVVGVPALIGWLERKTPIETFVPNDFGTSCSIPISDDGCTEKLGDVSRELGKEYGRNVWMLLKPTITLMLLASVAAGIVLTLVPWDTLLAKPTAPRLALVSFVSTLIPVPIALDVMFAARLHAQGVAAGYVMVFLTTLGTYSVIPMVYLWREVSWRLALSLFAFFVLAGFVVGVAF